MVNVVVEVGGSQMGEDGYRAWRSTLATLHGCSIASFRPLELSGVVRLESNVIESRRHRIESGQLGLESRHHGVSHVLYRAVLIYEQFFIDGTN